MFPVNPFGNPWLGIVFDAFIVSYGLWMITGSVIILMVAGFRMLGIV